MQGPTVVQNAIRQSPEFAAAAIRFPCRAIGIASAGTKRGSLAFFTASPECAWSNRRLEAQAPEGPADSLTVANAEPVNLRRTIVRCFWIKSCDSEFATRQARADSSCCLPKNTLHNGCAPMRSLRLAVARFSRVSGSRKCVCASSPSRRIAQGILNAVTTRDCFPARSFPDGGLPASVRPR